MSTPHKFHINNISSGKHFITVRIDNRINDVNPGKNWHSVSNHTQSNWNGIIGEMLIIQKSNVSIDEIKIIPDYANKKIKIETVLQNETNKSVTGSLGYSIKNVNEDQQGKLLKNIKLNFTAKTGTDTIITEINYSNFLSPWDEFNPNVYELYCGINR